MHRLFRQLYAAHQQVPYAPSAASYWCYAKWVATRALTWEEYLRTVTLRARSTLRNFSLHAI